MSTNANILKKKLIACMESSLGIVTTACKMCGCSRTTFYKYYNRDKKFREAIDDLQNLTLDFVESQLHEQIKEGNTTATIFYLKTKGKKRGFIERQEIQMDGGIESKIIQWTPAKDK